MSKDYSFFGWIKFVYNTNDKQVFSLCNAEGFMYLYFLRTTGFFFLVISAFSILLFLPLFSLRYNEGNIEIPMMKKLTIENAYENTGKLWLVLFFSLLYTCFAYFHVYNYKKKLTIIQNTVQTEDSMDSDISLHTIHIRGINKSLTYLDAKKIIKSFFDISFTDIVEIQVIPNYDQLMYLIDKKYEVEAYHDKYKNQNKKSNSRAIVDIYTHPFLLKKEKVDGEIYYNHWTKIVNNMLNFYRKLNLKKNTGNAFISFNNPYIVDKILKNKHLIFAKQNTFHGQLLNIKVDFINDYFRTGKLLSHLLLQILYGKISNIQRSGDGLK
jgi:hypothetical protein